MANNHDVKDLTSHGRGRWFEPSIAHSIKDRICRKNILTRLVCWWIDGPLCSNLWMVVLELNW
jgi:hypothetical protein